MDTLLHLILALLQYAVMGALVGSGIVVARKFPKVGEFLQQNPILGWTLAFTAGAAAVTLILAAAEFLMLVVANRILG